MIQVAFYKGKSRFLNRLISWWLRGPYSHCELVLGCDEAGQAICASSSIMDGGVRTKHITLDPEHWDIVPIQGNGVQAWAWLQHHHGEGYDYGGALGFITRLLGQGKSRWFCSEAVAAMLGIPDSWRFDPCSLHAALTYNPPAQAGFFTPTKGEHGTNV